MVRTGALKRKGRGRFAIGQERIFIPETTIKIKSLYPRLVKEFPYVNFCLWNTSSLNQFMRHQPGRFYLIVEADKDADQSVFYYLKENKSQVFINPTNEILEKYIPYEKETMIVKKLVSEAPVQVKNGICFPTLEKILVDIFCDDLIFAAQQGAEMRNIFEDALGKFTVNENRMFRYAERRGKIKNFQEYLQSIHTK